MHERVNGVARGQHPLLRLARISWRGRKDPSANDRHRALRIADHAVRYRAKTPTVQQPLASMPEHDEIYLVFRRLIEDLLRYMPDRDLEASVDADLAGLFFELVEQLLMMVA